MAVREPTGIKVEHHRAFWRCRHEPFVAKLYFGKGLKVREHVQRHTVGERHFTAGVAGWRQGLRVHGEPAHRCAQFAGGARVLFLPLPNTHRERPLKDHTLVGV